MSLTPSSGIVEAKQLIWSADGANNNYTAQTSAGVSFLQDGASGYVASSVTGAKLFTLSSTWKPSTMFAFEGSLGMGSSGYTVNLALWDLTSNAIVSGSSISSTSTTISVIRSSQFTLIPGHVYGVTAWSSSTNTTTQISDASLIIFPQ